LNATRKIVNGTRVTEIQDELKKGEFDAMPERIDPFGAHAHPVAESENTLR
jgi:hypothetical protein